MDENHQDKTESKSLVAEDIKWVFNNRRRLWVPRYQRRRWKNFKNKFPFEWLNLLGVLAIPFVVTFMGLYFTQQVTQQQTQLSERQHRVDLQIAQDQQRAAILQTYIDNIQDLLLNHNLLKSTSGDDVATLARARTLTALRGLDPQRKGILLNFLYEANLIGYSDHNTNKLLSSIIDLTGAHLTGADLTHTYLTNANLANADLTNTHLSHADLIYTYLTNAHLSDADLSHANLTDAFLTGADLTDADLTDALLTGSAVTQQQLDDANSCKDTLLPPGLTCHRNQ